MSKPARVVAHTTLEVSPKAACTLSACVMHLWRRASFGHPATCAHGIPDFKANELSALLHAGAASVVNALRPTAIISRLKETQGGCRVGVAPHSKVSQFCKPRGRRTGFPRCKWPSSALSLVTDRRALMGRGLVQGSSSAPRTCPWWVLQVRKCPPGEIGTSALRHRANRSSDARKDPLIRRAVSTLVYATLLHPAQELLPVNLHPSET